VHGDPVAGSGGGGDSDAAAPDAAAPANGGSTVSDQGLERASTICAPRPVTRATKGKKT
jgi:hypothetical protein